MIVQIQTKEELAKILEQAAKDNKLVVIDFYATWCAPCKMIAPNIEELDNTLENVVFLKVDVDEGDELVTEYDITSMPTFLYFKNQQVVDTVIGANFERMKRFVDKHCQ